MLFYMKGGSIASNHVQNLLPNNCKTIVKPYKFKVPNSDLNNMKFYQVASGRKRKKRNRRKRGGSVVSKLVNNTARLRSLSLKKNPGPFPNPKNRCINWLNKSPKIVGGKRKSKKKNRKMKGGSDWVGMLRSFSWAPQKSNHLKKFTKNVNQYVQSNKNIHTGPAFNPFKTVKNLNNNLLNKLSIEPYKITQKVHNMMKNINKSPMFRIFK